MRRTKGTLSLLLVIWTVFALGALSPTSAQQQLSVERVYLISPVSPGNAASITVKTAPTVACTITVTYKSGPSRARGLVPKTADEDGIVGWAWIVGTQTTPGEWPITVTCSEGGKQETLEISFVVQ